MEHNSAQRGNFLLVLVAMVLGVLIGLMFASHPVTSRQDNSLQHKMGEVMKLVEEEYVDSIDADSLSERLIAKMLSELDPHSVYISAHDLVMTEEQLRGNFEGVGIVLHREGDSSFVGQLVVDGPSMNVGLIPGDLILTVDGDTVSGVGMSADTVVSRLRGPRGSRVTVGVIRHAGLPDSKPLQFTIRRNVVPRNSVPYHAMLDRTTGYLLLNSFTNNSYDEFRNALRQLKRQGLEHLILDLRGNGGGSLPAAIGIANELLPQGSLIVYTQGAHEKRQDVNARAGGLFTEGRVTVMVDESSASASEVVSGALQDNDRATIVGHRTFGKGLVQREFELGDGSAVLLTVARYYTPSGRCIQRPYTDGTDEYYRQYLEQVMVDMNADSLVSHINDSTPYYTVGGRTVYGGGGIVPDRLLPYHKDETFAYYNRLASKGLLNKVAFGLVRRRAEQLLRQYPTADAFVKGFRVDEELVTKLTAEGEALGIATDHRSLQAQHRLICNMLKAYVGLSLYGEEAFYPVLLQEDDDLKQVINF